MNPYCIGYSMDFKLRYGEKFNLGCVMLGECAPLLVIILYDLNYSSCDHTV